MIINKQMPLSSTISCSKTEIYIPTYYLENNLAILIQKYNLFDKSVYGKLITFVLYC